MPPKTMTKNTARQIISRFTKKSKKTTGRKKHVGELKSSYVGFPYQTTYFQQPGKPVWTPRKFEAFAEEAYIKNVIAFRAIQMIATSAASVSWVLHQLSAKSAKTPLASHPLLYLLEHPNPCCAGAEFFENVYAYKLISGNSYIHAVIPSNGKPQELHYLRPDRVAVIAGKDALPAGYRYTVGNLVKDFMVNRLTGQSPVLHLRCFHPTNDWYGLSPVEAAAYSIDQHNQAGQWNQSLLQNGARPSGALVVNMGENTVGTLTEEQYQRLKSQVDEQFSGAANAGRPILLEGGLDWREMSLSPKDMDFIEMKHSAARDIALAFGVPPQLLGIPGDNTYSNLAEARLALWEQTILPLLDHVTDALNHWLVPLFGDNLVLSYDENTISALSPRREKLWNRISQSNFLTINEKRKALGLGTVEGGNRLG